MFTTTLTTILHNGDWDLFCEEKGISVYACAEGFGHTIIDLTAEELVKYKLIKQGE